MTPQSPRHYRFGIAGGFDVPGTVVPGTAGGAGETVDDPGGCVDGVVDWGLTVLGAGDVVAGGVDGVWLEGLVGVWLRAATRTVEHAAVTIRRLTVAVAVCLITSPPGC